MAAELKHALSVDPKLVEGKNGIFTIKRDGKVVFSIAKENRFPEPGEVTALLRAG